MAGFVNALAILIFMAQLRELDPRAVIWLTYVLVAASLGIFCLLPQVTRVVPSPLATIIVLTTLTMAFGWDGRRAGAGGGRPLQLVRFCWFWRSSSAIGWPGSRCPRW
jgi:SulP family sulfate permease